MKKLSKLEYAEYSYLKNLLIYYNRNQMLLKTYRAELDGAWYRASGAGSIDYSKPVAGKVSSKGDAPNRIVQMLPEIERLNAMISHAEADVKEAEAFMNTLDPLELKIISLKFLEEKTWSQLEIITGIPESTCRSIVFQSLVSRLHHNNDLY